MINTHYTKQALLGAVDCVIRDMVYWDTLPIKAKIYLADKDLSFYDELVNRIQACEHFDEWTMEDCELAQALWPDVFEFVRCDLDPDRGWDAPFLMRKYSIGEGFKEVYFDTPIDWRDRWGPKPPYRDIHCRHYYHAPFLHLRKGGAK